MEIDTGGSLCALDNPIVASFQLLMLLNGLAFLSSTGILLFRRLTRRLALPSPFRTFGLAALSLHALLGLLCIATVGAVIYHDAAALTSFLSSGEFLLIAGPSFFGIPAAIRIRALSGNDRTPSLMSGPISALPAEVPPRA